MNDTTVFADNLSKHFGDFLAVDRVNFSVSRGEIFGFLGPNGAGKSTTIRMLCGIIDPTSGTAEVAGRDLFTQREEIKQAIGYMSQKFSLYQELTVEENIDFYSGIYGLANSLKKVRKEWVIEMAGLAEQRALPVQQLAAGWKQKLSLGCAVLHEPPVVFLDEPTSGVDVISRRRFWDLIYAMSEGGTTVFVTTHYMDEAEYCDRLALMYRGQIIAEGSPSALKQEQMPGTIFELSIQPMQLLDDVVGELHRFPEVKDVAVFGSGLHVLAQEGEPDMSERLISNLSSKGIEEVKIREIQPSLEDVFVSLIKARELSETPQGEVRR